MKRFYYLATALLVLAGASGCKKNADVQEPEQQSSGRMIPFTVTAGQGGQKTSMVDGVGLAWNSGDQLTVCEGDGSNSTVLSLTGGENTASGTFSGEISDKVTDGTLLFGLYNATFISGNQYMVQYSTSVPAEQTYNATSFQPGIYPSVGSGTYKADGSTLLTLSNPMGIIRIKLTGSVAVKKVKITTASANVAGIFSVTNVMGNQTIVGTGDNSQSVTITCSAPITLTSAGVYFNFVVAPFISQTVTVEVTKGDDSKFTKDINVAVSSSTATKQDVEVKEDKCGGTVPVPGTTLCEDACGNTYKTVVIGGQEWMAENLHCNKYSAGSDAESSIKGNPIGTSDDAVYTPYYTASTIASGGYLYNWAAAVGVADGESQTEPFEGNRQGICPNGWHIPTSAEWDALKTKIEETDGKGSNTAGKYLKNETGWEAKSGIENLNCYGFSALSAGLANGSSVFDVGIETSFWAAAPSDDIFACARNLSFYGDRLYSNDGVKYYGLSVRCLRD